MCSKISCSVNQNHSYKSCGYTSNFCDFNSTLYGKHKFYTSIYDKFRHISSCKMFSNINRVTNIFKTHPRLLLQPTYGCGWVLFVVCYRPAYLTVCLGQWVTRASDLWKLAFCDKSNLIWLTVKKLSVSLISTDLKGDCLSSARMKPIWAKKITNPGLAHLCLTSPY